MTQNTEVANFGEHLAYRAVNEGFYHLLAPPFVLAGKQIPGVGLHPNLEKATIPQVPDIQEEIKKLVNSSW